MVSKVVIGSNYGDEGKGLVTDYLASLSNNAIVIRVSGGAQAGHTVYTPEGLSHAFSHIGSGSFVGAPTYLSRFFVVSPLRFYFEYNRLKNMISLPKIYVDVAAFVTTPYDMIINRVAEEFRGINKHGSCGMGFGETVTRSENSHYKLTAFDLKDNKKLIKKLFTIKERWVPYRLNQLKIEKVSKKWINEIDSKLLLEDWIKLYSFFIDNVELSDSSILMKYSNHIFEGSQGLMLDQDRGDFPYVTYAHTGIKNVITLAKEVSLKELDVYYVTRAYLTRHGAGPLANELSSKPYDAIVDKTNLYNKYQGNLRFAWLDINKLAKNISLDLSDVPYYFKVTKNIVITCLDQMKKKIPFILGCNLEEKLHKDFFTHIVEESNINNILTSYGATRNDIVKNSYNCHEKQTLF